MEARDKFCKFLLPSPPISLPALIFCPPLGKGFPAAALLLPPFLASFASPLLLFPASSSDAAALPAVQWHVTCTARIQLIIQNPFSLIALNGEHGAIFNIPPVQLLFFSFLLILMLFWAPSQHVCFHARCPCRCGSCCCSLPPAYFA
jgi:hypothetical protein